MKAFSLAGNKLKIILHLLAWTILLGLPLYFNKRWQVGSDFIWLYYINATISAIIFYLNYLILLPGFFFDHKRHKYFITAFLMLIFFYFISDKANEFVFKYISVGQKTEEIKSAPEERKEPGPPGVGKFTGRPPVRQRQMHLFNYAFTSVFLLFFSMGLRVLERQSQIEKLQKEMEKEKLNSELTFLKNQISPHFFFNTLNNIYALISINSEDSKKAVLKLSKLMRYLLYESEQGNTRLSNEIDFMNNYIDLMKLRMSDKISLSVSLPGKYDDFKIPPLLFIPFIENAFKHGISYREKSFIEIRMTAISASISFRCVNSIIKSREIADSGHSGIGLENVNKRLNLLFPGKHDLKINKSDTEYEVLLKINIA